MLSNKYLYEHYICVVTYYAHNMLSNTYAESYKYVHIMNIICSYLYVVIYWVAIVYNTPDCVH